MQDVVYDDDHDKYDDGGNVYLYSDADDGYCKHDDCNNYDDHAASANTSSYSFNGIQPTLSSEGSIGCSSHRPDDKSEDQTPNSCTCHTLSSSPPPSPSVDSR